MNNGSNSPKRWAIVKMVLSRNRSPIIELHQPVEPRSSIPGMLTDGSLQHIIRLNLFMVSWGLRDEERSSPRSEKMSGGYLHLYYPLPHPSLRC